VDKDRVVPLDLGVIPEAAVSSGLLLQSEYSAYFLFNAMRVESDGSTRKQPYRRGEFLGKVWANEKG
jgi:hypothetical protein